METTVRVEEISMFNKKIAGVKTIVSSDNINKNTEEWRMGEKN